MRSPDERQAGIVFLHADDPIDGDADTAGSRPERARTGWVATAAVALLLVPLIVTTGSRSAPTAISNTVGSPSASLAALFDQHVPGAIAVSVRSVVAEPFGTSRTLVARTIDLVSGNVVITVTVRAGSAGADGRTVFSHDGYLIVFRFAGYYPPTRSQLRAIADDPRLIATGS